MIIGIYTRILLYMKKGTYVDGFVFVVPKHNLKAYRQMATIGAKVWRKHGALDYKECMIDDSAPKHVTLTFPKLTKKKDDETVWFSYIVFKSKAHRNAVNAKVMKDPLMNDTRYKDMSMPFDMKRMAYGGFKVMVDAYMSTPSSEITKNGVAYYQCEACKLFYTDRETADTCQAWCLKHKSCNLDIMSAAVQLPNDSQ